MSSDPVVHEKARAIGETVAGLTLMGTPWWSGILADVNLIATTIAAICGAIIGLAGVATLIRRRNRKQEG